MKKKEKLLARNLPHAPVGSHGTGKITNKKLMKMKFITFLARNTPHVPVPRQSWSSKSPVCRDCM